MAVAFGSCSKRSRLRSSATSSVRNFSKRSRSWPLNKTSTPERTNSTTIMDSTSPFQSKCSTESPILTSTPLSYRHHSMDSLLQEKSWMSDEWLTPIQTKEINIDGLITPEINQLFLKDLAINLFEEPKQSNEEVCKIKEPVASSDNIYDVDPLLSQESSSLVKRLSSYDHSSLDKSLVDSGYSSCSMDSTTFLIGKKMGLRHFDILSNLLNVEPNIVDQIVSYLSPDDIESVSCVCSTWKEYCDDSKLVQDIKKISAVCETNKENHRIKLYAKLTTSMNIPLKTVQNKECQSPTKCSTNELPSSSVRHNMFRKAASELLSYESLSKCPRCFSPAKLSMNRQRGNCKRRSCMFDFCVTCQIDFHHSTPCQISPKRTTKKASGICSKQSKNNLRRL